MKKTKISKTEISVLATRFPIFDTELSIFDINISSVFKTG